MKHLIYSLAIVTCSMISTLGYGSSKGTDESSFITEKVLSDDWLSCGIAVTMEIISSTAKLQGSPIPASELAYYKKELAKKMLPVAEGMRRKLTKSARKHLNRKEMKTIANNLRNPVYLRFFKTSMTAPMVAVAATIAKIKSLPLNKITEDYTQVERSLIDTTKKADPKAIVKMSKALKIKLNPEKLQHLLKFLIVKQLRLALTPEEMEEAFLIQHEPSMVKFLKLVEKIELT